MPKRVEPNELGHSRGEAAVPDGQEPRALAEAEARKRNRGIIGDLARRFLERKSSLHLTGKRADSAAVDYFVGAAAIAELQGEIDLAKHVAGVTALIVAVRGIKGVEELATQGTVAEEIAA